MIPRRKGGKEEKTKDGLKKGFAREQRQGRHVGLRGLKWKTKLWTEEEGGPGRQRVEQEAEDDWDRKLEVKEDIKGKLGDEKETLIWQNGGQMLKEQADIKKLNFEGWIYVYS